MKKSLCTIFIAVISLTCFISSEAAILSVPSNFNTIQDAVNAARANDTVLVAPGRYTENIAITTVPLTLASMILLEWVPEAIGSTIIDGNEEGSVITVDVAGSCTIRGFTLINGSNGGIRIEGAASPVNMFDLVVRDNSADGHGGGVYAAHNIAIRLIRSDIIDNHSNQHGGGVFTDGGWAEIEGCRFIGNTAASSGGALQTYGGNRTIMKNCLIAQNSGDYCAMLQTNIVDLDHVTVADNRGIDGGSGGLFMVGREADYLTNSIVDGNDGLQIYLSTGMDIPVVVSYSLVRGGLDNMYVDPDIDLVYEQNLDEDPEFVDSDAGDYRLTPDSPCVDSGDPEADPDPDGTTADLGALPLNPAGAWICGEVLSASNDQPIPNAAIYSPFGLAATGDEHGIFNYLRYGNFASNHIRLYIRPEGYLPAVIDTVVQQGDSIWFTISLNQATFTPSLDSIVTAIDSGSSSRIVLNIRNNGNGPVTWRATVANRREPQEGALSLQAEIPIGQVTGDDRIEGAVFDGENFLVSGAAGNDTNRVYIVSRDGELLGNFPQIGSSRYGYKDLEWDGRLLWGVGQTSIFALTPDGRTMVSWQDPLSPSQNIAIDIENGVVWICGVTTNIVACDRNGNLLGRTLNRMGMRMYGLAWCPDDPDGYNLYLIDKPAGEGSRLHKMNPQTGDTMLVALFDVDSTSSGIQSASVSQRYDRYGGSVLVTIDNQPGNAGGDKLYVYRLFDNSDWMQVIPDRGIIEAEDMTVAAVLLRTAARDSSWSFATGTYEGDITFANNGNLGDLIIPVTMTVTEPNGVTTPPPLSPDGFELFAAFPNPFNSSTTIRFGVGARHAVPLRLAVYDLSGRMVADLLDKRGRLSYAASERAVGYGDPTVEQRSIVWNAEGLPGGVYLIRLESGSEVRTIKTLLLK